MKSILFFFVLFTFLNSKAQWQEQSSGFQTPLNISDLYAVDQNIVWGITDYSAPPPQYDIDYLSGNHWNSIGQGTNNTIAVIDTFNSKLYVGGWFTSAGGTMSNYIASWDGTGWSPVGLGTNGVVETLCVYNGELYVGGQFTMAGGVTASGIAKWNGLSWSAVGSGVNGNVNSLCVYNGELFVGGTFTEAGGISAAKIAKWNGTIWSAIGSGINGVVIIMKEYLGELYVGGNFTTAGGLSVSNIAKWNGISWNGVGSGVNNSIYSFSNYQNKLFVGGTFTIAGGVNVSNIASWNGNSWLSAGSGTNGVVRALYSFNNLLYVGGAFSTAGGISALNISTWNDSIWSNVYNGFSSTVYTVNSYNNQIYVAGDIKTYFSVPQLFTKTINGGVNWIPDTIDGSDSISFCNIFAINENIAWAAGYNYITQSGGKIFKTIDGGSTWILQSNTSMFATGHLNFIHFFNANTGIVVGDPDDEEYFEVQYTADGGNNWTRIDIAFMPSTSPNEKGLVNCYSVAGNTLFFITSNKRIFFTEWEGLSWITLTITLGSPVYNYIVEFQNPNVGLTFYNGYYRTTNGGVTWNLISTPVQLPLDLKYVPGTVSKYVRTYGNYSDFTDDAGNTWNLIDTLYHGPLVFVDSLNGWSGGTWISPSQGGIYKWSGITGIKESSAKKNGELTVFPNPSEGKFTLYLSDIENPYSLINIFDALGSKVFSEAVSVQNPIVIDLSELAKGIYFVKIINDNVIYNSKLIIR